MALKIKALFAGLIVVASLTGNASAAPSGDFFMPTEVGGANFFPFKVGGVAQLGQSDNGSPTNTNGNVMSPIRSCPNSSIAGFYPCLDVSFWSPDFVVESVKTPYYSPTLGTSLGGSSDGHNYGGTNNGPVDAQVFQHTHWFRYPLMDLLKIMKDFKCLERGNGVDLAWMSEVIPWKKDAMLGALLSPDSFLFANPIAIASCIPEAASAQADFLVDSLWWCMGAWGTVYPLGNYKGISDTTTASAALTGKAVFEMLRGIGGGTGAILDHATAPYCAATPKSIWDKSHYKMQLIRPTKKAKAVVIGKSSLFWGKGANPPYKAGNNSSDEFMYMIYQKYHCCEEIKF